MTQAQVAVQSLMHSVDIVIDKELSLLIFKDKIVVKPKKKGSRPIILSISQWIRINAMFSRVELALDLVNC